MSPPLTVIPFGGVNIVQLVKSSTGKDGQQVIVVHHNIPIPSNSTGFRFAFKARTKAVLPSTTTKQIGMKASQMPTSHDLQNLSDEQVRNLLNESRVSLVVDKKKKIHKPTNASPHVEQLRGPHMPKSPTRVELPRSSNSIRSISTTSQPIIIRSESPESSIPTSPLLSATQVSKRLDKAERRRHRSKSVYVVNTESSGIQKKKKKKHRVKAEAIEEGIKREQPDKHAKWSKVDPNWKDKAVKRWMRQDAIEVNPDDDYVVLESDTEEERRARTRSMEL